MRHYGRLHELGNLCSTLVARGLSMTLHPYEAPRTFIAMNISYLKLDSELPTPRHAHFGDGGVDLYARTDLRLEAGERALIATGVAVAIPTGFAGLVVPRSGLAIKHGIGVANGPGLIDTGYRGEIKVVLINHGVEAFEIARGERIAQLVVVPVAVQEWVQVEELPDTDRGAGGFGSTGR